MNNIILDKINNNDFSDILELTSNLEIMKYIGDSKIWSLEKVKNFIKYCINEEKINDKKREFYYYKIVNLDTSGNKTFLGIIGFHTFFNKELFRYRKDFFQTVFISNKYQNLGVFSKAIKLLLDEIKKHKPKMKKIYSLVRQSNDKMISISNKKYIFEKEVKIRNELFNLYSIIINQSKSHIKSRIKSYKKSQIPHQSRKTKRKEKEKGHDQIKKTFLLEIDNFDKKKAEDFLIQRGNWVKYNVNNLKSKYYKPVDFLFLDHKNNIYNRKLNSIKCFVKNIVNEKKHDIGRKDELYYNLGNYLNENPKSSLRNYLIEQYNFNWVDIYTKNNVESNFQFVKELFDKNPSKIWIYKPVSSFLGMNIEIFRNYDEFKTFMENFLKKQIPIWNDPSQKSKLVTLERWVLQEYIISPYLFENKKFHIRPLFLYHKLGNQKIGYLLNKILVAHAYEDYKPEDFQNKRIHDTHFASTSRRLYFHDDFIELKVMTEEQVSIIEKQIIELGNYVFNQLNATCYPESKECYEVFGMDLLIDSTTLTIKLMEVQITNISFGHFDDDKIPNFSNIFEYVYCNTVETVIDKYFPPINPIQKLNGFKKIYQKPIENK
jgi:hypothetical protein